MRKQHDYTECYERMACDLSDRTDLTGLQLPEEFWYRQTAVATLSAYREAAHTQHTGASLSMDAVLST